MNLTLPKNNTKEISRLRHLVKRYYNKIFKMSYSPTTLLSYLFSVSISFYFIIPAGRRGLLKYRYDGNTIEHHCRYYSGTFNNTEIKWEINRKELYSVYKCLLSFEPYIVYNKFIIRTNNTQVKWWLTRKIQDSVTTKEIRRLEFSTIIASTFR